jgi:hypothetical protein
LDSTEEDVEVVLVVACEQAVNTMIDKAAAKRRIIQMALRE